MTRKVTMKSKTQDPVNTGLTRWMYDYRFDPFRDFWSYNRESLGVVDISDKLREHRPQWIGHVMRRDEKDLVRVIHGLRVEGRRDRGKPKLT